MQKGRGPLRYSHCPQSRNVIAYFINYVFSRACLCLMFSLVFSLAYFFLSDWLYNLVWFSDRPCICVYHFLKFFQITRKALVLLIAGLVNNLFSSDLRKRVAQDFLVYYQVDKVVYHQVVYHGMFV